LSWNAGAQRLKGYSAEEIVGRHFSTYYTREAVDSGWPQHELKVATAEGRFEDEGWRVRKDGSRFWANVVITALRDEEGRLLGISKITRDLTDRKLHEEALRQSEERFRLLIEGVVDYAIFMLDTDGVVTSWNAGAERIKGYKRDEIIGKHLSRFFLPEDIEAGKPWEELAAARRDGRAESEGWRVKSLGHETLVVHDGTEALRAAPKYRPSIVLLDIGMPGLDGYEVARRLRAMEGGERLRIVAVTGWGQDADREKSREAGFDLQLVKPVEPRELVRVLDAGRRKPALLRHHGEEEESGEEHEVYRALEHGGAASRERERRDDEREREERRFLARQAELELQAERDRKRRDRRDREPDGRKRRAEREVEARLHPVSERRAHRRHRLGEEHEERDHDAQQRGGRGRCLERRLDAR
jgi:PAS domain S-box-containing protein